MSSVTGTSPSGFGAYDAHQNDSAAAQWQADKWMIAGTILMGTAVLGLFGLPMFFRGMQLQMRAAKQKYEELFKRIAQHASTAEKSPRADAYEAPHQPPKSKQAELRQIEGRLISLGVRPNVAQSLVSLVAL